MKKPGSKILHGMLMATSGLVASTLIASSAAFAGGGPTGGHVAVGSATIVNASPTQTVVNQSSKKALINWNSFSVPYGSSVQFNQPNSKSLTVNRVTGANASAIDGQLLANGNIWLINANGIMFGQKSQVNVGALIATTSDIADGDFKDGKYAFKPSANPNASVVNKGTITAGRGGSIVLSAPSVSNEGLIQADLGTVVLGGAKAFTVDLDGDNLLRYEVTAPVSSAPKTANGGAASALVSNSGTIEAMGGRVMMTARAAKNVQDNVINNTGMVEATSVSSHNGEIDLDAGPDGTLNIGGTLDASGTASGQTGGTVKATAGTVTVADGAKIDASGDSGGGTVLIGGDAHGQGSLAHAQRTIIGKATISADAVTSGNGGKVVAWSDDETSFDGTITARGGAKGGNGGFVETSGHNLGVTASARVDAGAAVGAAGDWLLDPAVIEIQTTSGTTMPSNGTIALNDDPGATDKITPSSIVSVLATTNVSLQANQEIDVNDALSYNSSHSLTLLSKGDVDINANVQNSGSGNIAIVAGWNGSLSGITNSGNFGQNDGGIVLSGNISVGSKTGATTLAADDLTITGSGAFHSQIGFDGAASGNITVLLIDNLSTQFSGTSSSFQIGNGYYTSPAGNVGGDINITIGGAAQLTQANGTIVIGNRSSGTQSGNVTLIAGTLSEDHQQLESSILADIAGGDVTVGLTSGDLVFNGTGSSYTSTHNLTLMAGGDLTVFSSIQNTSSGNITLVGGWNGTTRAFSPTMASTVYGNNDGEVAIESTGSPVAVGSASGRTLVAGNDVHLYANSGDAQIGYRGAGGGDIYVLATGDLELSGGADSDTTAIIGNGVANGSMIGNVGGNISLTVAGYTTIDSYSDEGTVYLGNVAADGYSETGAVTLLTGGGDLYGEWLPNDLDGGNVFVGFTGTGTRYLDDLNYSSANSFTWAAVGNVTIDGDVQNSGTGSINIVAGWDGHTTTLSSLSGSTVFGQSNQGNVTVTGGEGSPVSVGSAGGTTLVEGFNVILDGGNQFEPDNSAAQIGYRGASTGNITVKAKHDVQMYGSDDDECSDCYAQIGNGGYGLAVSDSGSISITAGGNVTLNGGADEGSYAQIGNGGRGTNGADSGSILINAGNVTLTADAEYAQIGNGGLYSYGANNGTINVTATGNITLTGVGGGGSDEEDDVGALGYAQIGNGGAFSNGPNGGNLTVSGGNISLSAGDGTYSYAQIGNGGDSGTHSNSGSINVTAVNAISLIGGTDYAQIGDGGWGSNGSIGNVTVSAGGNIALVGADSSSWGYAQIGDGGQFATGTANGTVTVTSNATVSLTAGANGMYAQIGNGANQASGSGSSSAGNVTVNAVNVALSGSTSGSGLDDYAQIGNTAFYNSSAVGSGVAGGNVSLNVTGTTSLSSTAGAGAIWIGNRSHGGTETGSVSLRTFDLNTASDANGGFDQFLSGDLAGGAVTLALTDSASTTTIGGLDYSSGNNLSILAAGSLLVNGDIQNSGAGNIMLATGWNTSVSASNVTTTAGAYGNNGGSLTIGGASAGDAAVGSKSGTTTVLANNLSVLASAGNAQLGYHGIGGGNIVARTTGAISILDSQDDTVAQIGNGAWNISGTVGGNITIASVGNISIKTTADDSVAAIANIGGQGSSERGNISVTTNGTLSLSSTNPGVDENFAAFARVGNFNIGDTTGTSAGDISINAGNVVASASGVYSYTEIGTGSFHSSFNTGAVSGNITINTGNLTLTATDANNLKIVQARIGNMGSGSVTGNINVSATGNVSIVSNGFGVSGIGGSSAPFDSNGNLAPGQGVGDINVQSGGAISLLGTDGGNARIESGGYKTGTVTVSATGDITLNGVAGAAIIGAIANGNSRVNVAVSSSTGKVDIEASENGASQIGTAWGGVNGAINGNVTVTASDASHGNITIVAAGDGSLSQIGNMGYANVSGSVALLAGNVISASGGEFISTDSGNSVTGNEVILGNALEYDITSNGTVFPTTGAGGTTITAPSFTINGTAFITGSTADVVLTKAGSALGSAASPLEILAGSVAIDTNNASAYVDSPNGDISIGVGSDGISLGTGSLFLTAAGSISQTESLQATSLKIISSDGDISLTDTGNSFETASVSASGDASLYDGSSLSVSAATVGGDFVLTSAGGIGQSGSINADTLNVTAGNGDVLLTNASNAISNASLAASGNVTLYDASDLNVTGGSAGGDFTILDIGSITFLSSIQLNGGALLAVAGWDGTTTDADSLTEAGAYGNGGGSITIGGEDASGDVAVGSSSGETTLAASSIVIDSENGYAQVGYHGAGEGDISVDASSAIAIVADRSSDSAQIGNGGMDVSGGTIGGNITVNSASGGILISSLADQSVASIGNLGGTNSSLQGNINIDTNGQSLVLFSDNPGVFDYGFARIGNFVFGSTTGTGSGNISIQAGDVVLDAVGGASFTDIGNGTFHDGFADTGALSGDIDLSAATLTMVSGTGASSFNQARIGNLGSGTVTGDINVSTTGDILIESYGAGVSSIGSVSAPLDSNGFSLQGAGSGDITVQSGGTISLLGADGGSARIESGGFTSGSISVTAASDILLSADSGTSGGSGSAALIGSYASGNGGVNISVTSTGGSVDLEAVDPNSAVLIGNAENSTVAGNLYGNITVTSSHNVVANASGAGSLAQIGNVAAGLADPVSGEINVTAGSAVALTAVSGAQALVGHLADNDALSGNVTVTARSISGIESSIANDLVGGNFSLNSLGSGALTFKTDAEFNSTHDLVINANGDVVFDASLQNAGSGDISVASAGDVTVGGSGASGDVAVGSQSGTTSISGVNLTLAADNGYAQIGYHGAGTGAISVTASGDLTMSGGDKTGYYAQIGDGGYDTSGSIDADIIVDVGGDLAMNGGDGTEAYVQIGNGGAESNSNSTGYDEKGDVSVAADSVVLSAGAGDGSYAQIGAGGYKAGTALNGTASIGGNISVVSNSAVHLLGNGTDAYAQIGNGGDLINYQVADGSSGELFGDISVESKTLDVLLTAGGGDNAYAQIGNGGQGENTPATGASVNFTISGAVQVADLTVTGSDTGTNAYGQVGNGDASKTGTGNVSGSVTLGDGVTLVTVSGKAPGASANFGNVTGNGTVTGTVPTPTGVSDPATLGSVASVTQNTVNPASSYSVISQGTPPQQFQSSASGFDLGGGTTSQGQAPLEKLSDSSDSEGTQASDSVADSVGKSLDGGKTMYVTSKTLIPGVLKQIVTVAANNPHGIPPADVDYSSWGNEALWRW